MIQLMKRICEAIEIVSPHCVHGEKFSPRKYGKAEEWSIGGGKPN